jgi:hypothetical protein
MCSPSNRLGFRVYRQSGITLRLADRTALDVELEVGQPTQSVEVTAAAPLLQTASGEVSLNVEAKKISTLPLDGRNFIPSGGAVSRRGAPERPVPAAHQRQPGPRTNEYIYDGISVLQPEPGQVVYYPVIDGWRSSNSTSMLIRPSTAGRTAGPSMVIGKSGSNSYTGNLFEFFRNEALNARNLFAATRSEARISPESVRLHAWSDRFNRTKRSSLADWQGTRLRTGFDAV